MDPSSLSGDGVRVVFEDLSGDIWIGTGTSGLNRYEPDSNTFQRFVHDPVDPTTLSHNKVQAIHQGQDGRLWIGTPAGLNEYDRDSQTFKQYTRKHGLASDVIYSIVEDNTGILWLSTNQGISRFDPGLATFQNYDVSDGLQANEFNSAAGVLDQDGLIVFGGINGITRFHPDSLTSNRFDPPMIITNVLLSNKPVDVSAEGANAILEQPIHISDSITLTHKDPIVSFEFVSLDYSAPSRNVYQYRLSGFDEKWVETTADNRFATFTGLSAGDYELQIRGTNSDGRWSSQEAQLAITVLPPPWGTWWAYTLYALVMLSGLGLYVRAHRERTRQLERLVLHRTSELAEKNAELEIQKSAAEAAADAKTTFLATMSHEIRTPMNAVMGMLNLLSESKLSREQADYVETIHDSSAALLGIVDQILQYSKLEQGYAEVESIPFNPRRLIRGVATLMKAVAEEKGLTFRTVIADDVPQNTKGDPEKLRQIITNVLSNAVKFTHTGGITLQANRFHRDAAPTILRLRISDTGVGIPADRQDRVFEAFSQTDATISRQYGGTGMGLAICKELSEALGGNIGFDSVEGQGTTFQVEIPFTPVPIGEESSEMRYRILLVEDIRVNRQIIAGLLESKGHAVTACGNGIEAMEALTKNTFDVVLLDLHMPDMDGFEVAREIRAMPSGTYESLPIIALTAAHPDRSQDELKKIGFDTVLRKPFLYSRFIAYMKSRSTTTPTSSTATGEPGAWISEPHINQHIQQLGLESVSELLDDANTTIDQLSGEIVVLAAERDLEGVRSAAHKLRGTCQSFGFPSLGEHARKLEDSASVHDLTIVNSEIGQLSALISETRRSVLHYLEQRGAGRD